MKWKEGKLLTVVIAILFSLIFTGCNIGGNKEGINPSREDGHKFLWYEKHRIEGGKYYIFVATEDGAYGYYYENDILTEIYFREDGERTEKSFSMQKMSEVEDMGIDKDGNLYIFSDGKIHYVF